MPNNNTEKPSGKAVPDEGDPVGGIEFQHDPVMLAEVLHAFAPVPPGWIVDCTLGGAGHAAALLDARGDLSLVGIDRDQVALDASAERLARFGERVRLVHAGADQLASQLDRLGIDKVSGVFLDLGVSSPQIDRADRGFSYRFDGPLDMRMDRTQPLTAEDVVNGYSTEELTRVLAEYGDVPRPRRVAETIVRRRPLSTTGQLADAAAAASPAAVRRRGHPAKRVFQAVRIEVNGELDHLVDALDQAIDRLVFGGRVAVLAYHSGEDRIVKERFRRAGTGGCTCPQQLPCVCGAVPEGVAIGRAIKASAEEIERNRRSESVRLRILEKREAS